MQRPKICVVGASNIDLISYAPRLPKLGETIPGTRFQMGFGGKGANQAVMAAKLGGDVAIVTKVGQDIFGEDTRKNFAKYGIDTTYAFTAADSFTGVAPIWVEESSGNNAIIVALGANDLLSPADVGQARPALEAAQVVVCQWELQLDTALAALRIARGGRDDDLQPGAGAQFAARRGLHTERHLLPQRERNRIADRHAGRDHRRGGRGWARMPSAARATSSSPWASAAVCW